MSSKKNAESLKAPDVLELSEVHKFKLISVHRKNLLNEIMFLEDFGCESSLIFQDTSGQVYNFGSSAGFSFLCLNPDINIKFQDHFGEAIKKTDSRVPYLREGFTVENLPDGIFFKKPFHYGTKQLQAIMEKKSEIKFMITSNANVNLQSNRDFIPSPTQPETVVTLLSRIVDRQCAERVVRLSDKIKEQDVEVVELRLDQEERLRLNEYIFYFEDDAWLAVGANIQHSTEAQGLIVPVFTESEDEKFWLFYTIQNPSKLVKASFTYKIKGYWLDLQGQSNYKLLNNHQDYVTIANLIKNGPYGPLYFLQGMEISDDQYFNIPEVFNNAIFAALRSSTII